MIGAGGATKKRGGRASETGDAVAVLAAFQLSTTVIKLQSSRSVLAWRFLRRAFDAVDSTMPSPVRFGGCVLRFN
jgi:hypothetical protein